MQSYPTRYNDQYGEELTTICNDGKTLRMNIRGVEFEGNDFDSFEPDENIDLKDLNCFTFDKFRSLCNCKIECEVIVQITSNSGNTPVNLKMSLELGKATERGNLDKETVTLALNYQGKAIYSKGTSGWFEDELLDIQKQLPEEHYLRCCFGCAYSDYSPAGHGLFGGMACFRNSKEQYLNIKTKVDYWQVEKSAAEIVQEIHLCPEFEIRKVGTGYRG